MGSVGTLVCVHTEGTVDTLDQAPPMSAAKKKQRDVQVPVYPETKCSRMPAVGSLEIAWTKAHLFPSV